MTKKPHNSRISGLNGVAQSVAHREPKKLRYLRLRGQVWGFNRRAPKSLKLGQTLILDTVETIVGLNGFIRFSLQTRDLKEAAKLARKYAHLVDEAAAPRKSRALKYPAVDGIPTPTEIELAAAVMYARLLAADSASTAIALKSIMSPGADCDDTREPDRYSWTAADLPPETSEGEVFLLNQLGKLAAFYVYQTSGKVVYEVTAELAPFASAFRRLIAALEDRRRGKAVPTPEEPVTNVGILFSELYEKYRLHRINNKVWKHPETSHSRDYFPIVKDFIAVVGDKPISTLKKADARKYSEYTMSRADIGLGTKSRNFDRIKAILRFGEKDYDILSITSPLEVEAAYRKIHQSYKKFTVSELKLLFESDEYKNNTFSKPSQYWMPMLGLHTGARIAELASLDLARIETLAGRPSYFLSHPEGDTKGGKNEFAPRWVPVHPALLAAGFMKYVELLRSEGHSRLFPCLGRSTRDGFAKRATDDFVKYRRQCGVGAGDGEGRSEQAFHSFRSTLISAMINLRIDGDTRRALVGHATKEVTGLDDKRDIHTTIYDQSDVQIEGLSLALSRVDFGLTHAVFKDTVKMSKARNRKASTCYEAKSTGRLNLIRVSNLRSAAEKTT